MSRISRLKRGEVTPEMVALYDKVFALRGNVPNMFRVMAHRPEIFSTMMAHFAAVLTTGTVPTKLKELIIVRTSQVNVTPYCLASHTILAKGLGWTDEQLANLADLLLTLRAVAAGRATEANGVMSYFLHAGSLAAGVFKVGLVSAAVVLLWILRRRSVVLPATAALTLALVALVAYEALALLTA